MISALLHLSERLFTAPGHTLSTNARGVALRATKTRDPVMALCDCGPLDRAPGTEQAVQGRLVADQSDGDVVRSETL